MKTLRILFAVVVCGLLTGCPSVTLVKPGPVTIQDHVIVEPSQEWSHLSGFSKWDVLTVDGSRLQRVSILGGLEDGETIFSFREGVKAPKFKSNMTSVEIADAIKASVAAVNIRNFKILNLRPYTFGGEEGFKFDCTYKTKEGLDFKCIFVGAVHKKRLNLIAVYGTSVHYFDKYVEEAERIIRSARFI
ncbi:MAG: hypothetical protein CMM52_11860 [Rhodospirillaceae bacterium]|nr:hypothetical protein [Rhodospirillaceae bacterium]|tara:strand:- start:2049 stop:2615 length:567 start_codon:yes stop_codon:yes gene_type:complete